MVWGCILCQLLALALVVIPHFIIFHTHTYHNYSSCLSQFRLLVSGDGLKFEDCNVDQHVMLVGSNFPLQHTKSNCEWVKFISHLITLRNIHSETWTFTTHVEVLNIDDFLRDIREAFGRRRSTSDLATQRKVYTCLSSAYFEVIRIIIWCLIALVQRLSLFPNNCLCFFSHFMKMI